ncbi:MAG TPA: response regulator [Bryobacteraceae bacterium]|nr:response regulator [Bryobacteraceae bacterium]
MPAYTQTRKKAGPRRVAPANSKRRPATILVIEDEHLLRVGVIRALKNKGFIVLEASDGAAALGMIRTHLGEIDVVLLDVMIPEVSSREVLENLRRWQPGLQVILTSTHSREMVDAALAGLPVELFLRKPFQLIDLFSLLGRTLSKKTGVQSRRHVRAAKSRL